MEYFSIENLGVLELSAIGLVVAVLVLFVSRRRGFAKGSFEPCPTLLTQSELRFYRSLQKVVPDDLMVCFKVRLADIVKCDWSVWKAGGYKISGKHIDFVLIDRKTTNILLGIELDDSSHQREDRIQRDHFVNDVMLNAGVALLRIPVQRRYDLESIQEDIMHCL